LIVEIREGLGDYSPTTETGHLTLHDLGELIRRAGKEAGFIVRSEYKVKCDGHLQKKMVDWVWLDADKCIVAFEIEGRNVAKDSQQNDFTRFSTLCACINVLALYQVDHDHSPKPRRRDGHMAWITGEYQKWRESRENPIEQPLILLDSDLMKEGGIESLQQQAKEAQTRLRSCGTL
jgi:hypothetical protein